MNFINDKRTFLNNFKLEDIENVKNPKFNLYVYYEVVDNKTYLKFGQTAVSAYERYNKTGDTQHDRMLKVWNSSLTDKQIHKELRKTFKKADFDVLNTDEAYEISSKEECCRFISTIDSLVAGDGTYRFLDYKPREYQQKVIDQLKEKFLIKDEVLLNLSTRCGKSFIALEAAREMNINNILIITPFPNAEKSFEEVVSYHKSFDGYNYISFDKDTKINVDNIIKSKNVIFVSFQYFDFEKENCKDLIKINFDLIIIDEEHNTSDSFRSTEILKNLKSNKRIFMSGTPFNDIWSGRFDSENTISFDFIDFIEYSKTHDDIKLPELYIKNVDNISDIKKSLFEKYGAENFKDIDIFNYNTIFSQERYTEWFFKWLVDEDKLIPKWSNDWFEFNEQNNIIIFADERKQCDVVYNALKILSNDKNSAFSGYNIIKVSGNGETEDSSEYKINEKLDKNKKNIIISCGKLTTGVTINKLDTIWFFRNTESTELFIQILFRIMTAYDGKDKSQMYCFNSKNCLKVFQEYAQCIVEQDKGSSFQSVIERILKCINFTNLSDNYKWKEETPMSFLKRIREIPFVFRPQEIFSNLSRIDLGKLHLSCEAISEKDLKITDKIKEEKNSSDKTKAKAKDEKDKIEIDIFSFVKKKLYQALKFVDRTIFINIEQLETYKDLEKFVPKYLKGNEDVWKILLENNKTKINQVIDDIKYKIEDGKAFEIYKNLTMVNNEDYRTPSEIIEKMINYFDNGAMEKEDVYLDPCCGTGFMLLYLNEEYGIPTKNLYGVDISPENVELCHAMGLTNVFCGDILELNINEELKKVRDMKFDKIIMNPPYNIGSKIIDKIKGKAEETVILAPLSNFKHHHNYEYVRSFEIVNNKMFDAVITPNLGICSFSEENLNEKWDSVQYVTFDQNCTSFYKVNSQLPQRFSFVRCDNSDVSDFDYSVDFIELNRLPDEGNGKAHGYGQGNNIGYKINVLKEIPEKLTSGLCAIHFDSPEAKNNFTTWAYSSKDKTNLANKVLYGLHLQSASKVCSLAIPQIDWKEISNNEKWKEGNYDEAVLEVMGLTSEKSKSWEELQYITFDQNYISFYKKNSKLPQKYSLKEYRNSDVSDFDYSVDFIESSRLPNGQNTKANGYTIGNNIGYKINVLKEIPEKLNSNIGIIHFDNPEAKNNFTTWAYSSKDKTNLANNLIYGINKNTVSNACSIAIPQIDWKEISNNEKWKEGNYDEAVLDELDLKWNDDKTKII